MDEGTLNDLLECSVCLERLDTSSKVLPCQHTFCRKCLEEIVDRHKELRCPECRVLVPLKIDELPPNVLLMRILEGMRNSAPKKQTQRTVKGNNAANIVHTVSPHTTGTPDHKHITNKQTSPHVFQPHQTYAKALYDYTSKEPEDLSFKRGEMIVIKKRIDNNWYQGECGGKIGVFPLSYVQVITPLPSNIPQCKALYDFRMTNDDEEGCLTFNKGDIISVIRRVDENWAEGKLEGRIGIFPLAFVELNNLARSLMKLSTNAQPGPSRLAPPTPTAEDSAPLIPTDHSRIVANVHLKSSPRIQQIHHAVAPQMLPTSDSSSTVSSGSSSTTTPNTSSSNTSSTSSTAPSSPASPPPRSQPIPSRSLTAKLDANVIITTPQRHPNNPQLRGEAHSSNHHHNREKRHSFSSLPPPQQHPNVHRHSAEILSPESDHQQTQSLKNEAILERPRKINDMFCVQLPAPYVALYPYKPQKSDELELRKGGIYMVTERCQDGWFKGTSNRTQKCGVFPGNYVTLAQTTPRSPQAAPRESTQSRGSSGKHSSSPKQAIPPELPPRSGSPPQISSSWHGHQDDASVPLGRSSSAIMTSVTSVANCKVSEKAKDRREKGTVSLMKRLTSMKRSKSPPPATYSMDNPVFEDSSVPTSISQPVHVRSGSCPTQLLQPHPDHHKAFISTSQRIKHKERPSIITHSARSTENPAGGSASSPEVHQHRKSNSLDAGNRVKTRTQTVHERFRVIAPYPPNSEYELELQVNDIIYVHKKREDGWYKGLQPRTGRTGLFPASFVENY